MLHIIGAEKEKKRKEKIRQIRYVIVVQRMSVGFVTGGIVVGGTTSRLGKVHGESRK